MTVKLRPAKWLSAAFYRLFDRPKGTAWEAIVFSFRVLIFFLISKRNRENDRKLSSPSINSFAVRPRIWLPRTSKSTECHLLLIFWSSKRHCLRSHCFHLQEIIFFLISMRNGENDRKLSSPSNLFAVRPLIWLPRTSKSTESHLLPIFWSAKRHTPRGPSKTSETKFYPILTTYPPTPSNFIHKLNCITRCHSKRPLTIRPYPKDEKIGRQSRPYLRVNYVIIWYK